MQSRLVSVLDTALGQAPVLDLNFASSKTLDSRITFTRASTATFVNASGLVESAASGSARFTHDPVTLASLGLLVEESRTNLLLRSEEIDNASWSRSGVTITQNAGTSPDGATTAESVTATSTGTAVRFVIQSTTKAASAIQYAYSFWAKAVAGGRYITFSVDDGLGNGFGGGLDLSTGQTTGGLVGTGGAFTSVSAVQHVNGWWKVVVIGTTNIITTLRVAVNLAASLTTGYPSATLTAGDGILLWGMQIEAGSFVTSYIPTTGSSATRAADVVEITGTNFSSWFNSLGGTLVADGILGATSGSRRTFTLGGINLGVGTRVNGSASSIIWRTPTNYDALTGTVSAGSIKQAFSYEPNLLSGVVNGGTIVTNTPPSSLPALAAYIGASETGFDYWNGTIARIRYFRRRLPNANLQTLTT